MIDGFGNRCQRLTLPAGTIDIAYRAVIEDSGEPDAAGENATVVSPEDLPADVLPFLLPSRYCESDQLADVAWAQFGSVGGTWQQVEAVCDWVHEQDHLRLLELVAGPHGGDVLERPSRCLS